MPLPDPDRLAGSVWWRAVNGRLLRDGCEAVALAGGLSGQPSSPALRLWLAFISAPTGRNWYRAHNASVVSAYLENRELAEGETAPERFFMNVALIRVLYAHALVAAPRLAVGGFPLGRLLGDPRIGMAGAFLSLGRVLPDRYPLARDVESYIGGEHHLGRMLDYAVIAPRAQRLYEWSAEELIEPRLVELIRDGNPIYAWPFEDRHVWRARRAAGSQTHGARQQGSLKLRHSTQASAPSNPTRRRVTRHRESRSLGESEDRRQLATSRSGEGQSPEAPIPFTPRAKEVLDVDLGLRNHVGTEDILLALARVNEGEAITVLRGLAVEADQIRDAVITERSGPGVRRLEPRSRARGYGRRMARASVSEAPFPESGFRVVPGEDVLRLLMNTAARALEDGRTEMTMRDLLRALVRHEDAGPVFAELGVEEAAILAALDRRTACEEPPEATARG